MPTTLNRTPAVRFHADDLGLHPAIDRAVFHAFERGAVAGASILATGPTFDAAARQARALGLPLGLHLAVVDTAPLSPPAEIPSLVARDGRFRRSYGAVVWRATFGGLAATELRVELKRQLQRFAEADLVGPAGLLVDGHQHLHLLPPVFNTLLGLAREFQVTAFRLPIRSPHERRRRGLRGLGFMLAELLGRRARAAAAVRGIHAIPCWGVLHAGHLTIENARAVLESLPPDAHGQIICHPGDDDSALAAEHRWGYAWQAELATVLALAKPALS